MDETRRSRRAPSAGRPEQNVPPRDEDPHATPLGRGADPGRVRDTYPLSSADAAIAGQRGHGLPSRTGGPEGFVDRENEDNRPQRRDAQRQGPDASPNDESA